MYRIASNATANGSTVWVLKGHTAYGYAVYIMPTTGARFSLIKWEK